VQIAHDTAAHRFIVEIDGERAVLDYTLDGDTMTITHTGVPKPIARRGIAGELMRAALVAARSQRWKVVPVCSYAADYLAKHPAQASDEERQHESDLLDEALEESFPASDPPAVGVN
jgi:uncharacterized protein